MLQRDYFLRLVREFAEALQLLRNKKDREKQLEEMREMYREYLGGPYEFWHTAELSDVMDAIGQFPEDERFERMEMLAELYYAESSLHSLPIREMLLEKAFNLFDFCDRHSGMFSLERQLKIAEIENKRKATSAENS